MFTSRAEYRISLRADNADLRLTRKGAEFGLVSDPERLASLELRERLTNEGIKRLRNYKLFVTDWAARGGQDLMGGSSANQPKRKGHKKSAEEILGMPHVTLKEVEDVMAAVFDEERAERVTEDTTDTTTASEDPVATEMIPTPPSVYDTVEASVKYKSYVVRQERDIESWRKAQGARIPPDMVYAHASMPTFSKEEIEKLNTFRPSTFAEASQISGLTPQSLVYLYHHVGKIQKDKSRKAKLAAAAAGNAVGAQSPSSS